MSDMSMNGTAPRSWNGVAEQDPAEVTNALLIATLRAAEKGSTSKDTREVGEAAKAALAFAQAIVVLDPSLTQSGTPLEHELELEALRGANALEQAKLSASAPTPKKRTLRRTGDGYEMEG